MNRTILSRLRSAASTLGDRVVRHFGQPQAPATVPWRPRLAVALTAGVLGALLAYHQLTGRGWLASDFEYSLRAARRLLDGLDPYSDPTSHYGLPYPYDAQFPYPLFAAMIAAPFTAFDSYVAGALFVGCLTALMVFGVTREGWWRLSVIASPSYFVAASVANWSPLLMASAFLPLLQPLAITKPTMALPVIANYPSLRGIALMGAPALLSLIIFPTWPLHWLESVLGQPPGKYAVPLFMGPTLCVLLCAVWWRHRPARLLLMLACTPQHAFFYDQLLLWLVPQTLGQSLALSAMAWTAYFSWTLADTTFQPFLARTEHGPGLDWTAPLFYLPTLAVVLWQIRGRQAAARARAEGAAAQPLDLAA